MIFDSVFGHFRGKVVLAHGFSKVIKGALHDVLEDALSLLLDDERIVGDQRLDGADTALVLFSS